MLMTVHFLEWFEIDPGGRSFDLAPVREIAAGRILGGRETEREAIEDAIDRDLIVRYGAWVTGWRWATSEPGGGGPVRGWCCARDSLLRPDDADAMVSI